MTPAELERANTWLCEIVETLLEGVQWRQEGDEHRVVGQGGLSVNTQRGCWYQHSVGRGGHDAISLVAHLKGCNREAAAEWVESFLQAHLGTGSTSADDDDDHEIENAAITTEIINQLIDPIGTPAESYLRSRAITGHLPGFVRFLPHARCGEGAVAALLTARGRVIGVQLGYIDPDGRKTTVAPYRRTYKLEKLPEAVIELPSPNGATDLHVDTIICEGLEDLLSLAELGRAARIIGIPGIGVLKHVPVKKGERLLVVRDGDTEGSGADRGLHIGIDSLLLQGARVQITNTPLGEDANSLLESGGKAALQELLTDIVPAELSDAGEIARLAGLPPIEYDRQRRESAKRLGITLETLKAEVAKRKTSSTTPKADAPADDPDGIELLDEPVDLAQTLDAILVELQRYIVTTDTALATVGLWCAHTHLCHHDHIRLQRSPRLAIQARTPGAGKTTLLEAAAALVLRPRIASSITASTVLRVVNAIRPTLLIDEADGVLRDPSSDLLSILNAGDRRATAWVERSVPMPDGGWTVQRFSVWGPVAFAGIDELPPTQQDRSIVIQMQRALGGEIPEHLEDGTSPELGYLQRALATWAHALDDLPRPTLPELLQRQAGRVGDNWRPLIAIADLAGGRWPALARQAAMESVQAEAQPTRVQRLLISIRGIFDVRATQDGLGEDDRVRIPTIELIAKLLADDEEEWGTANRGRPISVYWLRDNLRHLLDPPGTIQWELPGAAGQRGKRPSGFYRAQFERAWERHLPFLTAAPSGTSEGSAVSEQPIDNPGFYRRANPLRSEASEGTDGFPSDAIDQRENSLPSNPIKSITYIDTSDPCDVLDGSGRGTPRKRRPSSFVRPNGHAGSNGSTKVRKVQATDDEIIQYLRVHPLVMSKAVAKEFKRTVAEVRELRRGINQ